MTKHTSRRFIGALMLGAALLAGGAPAAHAATPTWVTTNAKAKAVNLTIIAGYKQYAGGFSFNGAAKGGLTITAPLGYKINTTFINQNAMPHSVEVILWQKTMPVMGWKVAFKNAYSPNPTMGITLNKTQKFSFVADKAGKYQLICAVPGHAAAGMWLTFVVDKNAKAATIK